MRSTTLRRVKLSAATLGVAAVSLLSTHPASASPAAPVIAVDGYTTAETLHHVLHHLTVNGSGFTASSTAFIRVRAINATVGTDSHGSFFWSTSNVPCGVDLTVEATDLTSGLVATGSVNIDCAPSFP
jgi:hypothetical protein